MQKLELLAPAKNIACGIAAIEHGADAVYIGAPRFGARAAAGNSIDDIKELCSFAHLYNAKVFVTVNTIVYDSELNDILDMIHELDNAGVDALLVQDMGLQSMLKNEELHCHLHASTQTDNRTSEKVKWLANQGFKRVVLARELSIEEIATIHDNVPDTELEVFVHGALCVSYSGQCYASHHCFNRSANRGECAQFCRLAFTLKDADGRILEEDRHLLSLRDMAQINNIERLALAGAISFKIEGRLKDVDYVKNITAAYSEAINKVIEKHPDMFCRASVGHCTYTFTPNITKSFNRGFTTYFADGRQQQMVSFDTPKSVGEPIGKVKEIRGRSFNVSSTASFNNGDGLCYIDENHKLVGFRVNKVEGNRIYPLRLPSTLRPGTLLFRNLDQEFTTLLSKPSAERKIRVSFMLTYNLGVLTLKAIDESGHQANTSIELELQKAQKPQEDNIRKQLSKLGGTIYECSNIDIHTDVFIPSSMLADMRRKVVGSLCSNTNLRNGIEKTDASDIATYSNSSYPKYSQPHLYNAANEKSIQFYNRMGIEATAFENLSRTALQKLHHQGNSPMLMQCRYCLRNEMGYCTKNGKRTPWEEPLTICLPDGKEFSLEFDCKQCQMNIMSK